MLMMLRSFVFLLVIASSSLHAETTGEIAKKAHLANINALLIFTSQEGLNTGRYNFTNAGIDMELYNLPFTYHFEAKENSIDYFIVGNAGYSRTFISRDIEIPPISRLNYENHIRTYTTGIGGGARYKATNDIHFSIGAEAIYSRSGVSVKKPDDNIGDAIEDFFKQNYNENISYKLFAIGEYKPVIYDYKPYARLSYKLYETKSLFTFDELASFNTDSSITTLAIGAETPKLLQNNKNHLTLEAYFHGNYLSGVVAQSVRFNSYRTIGVVAYWYTPDDPWWAERFFFEASTVQSSGLNGYNIGIGFTINF